MANSSVTYKEIRFTGLDSELTHCFVLCKVGGDSPIGIQGWHHKAFPSSWSVSDIVASLGDDSPFMWVRMHPNELCPP